MAGSGSKKYILGLRGSRLRAAQIWAVILPAYILFVAITLCSETLLTCH